MKTKLAALFLLVSLVAFAQFTSLSVTSTMPPGANPTGASYHGAVSGNTTYCYWVVTNFVGGSVISPSTCVKGAPASLSSGNNIFVSWTSANGASSYDLLRTGGAFPQAGFNVTRASGLTTTSYTDVGGSLTSYAGVTPPGTGTALMQVNSRDYSTPTFEIIGVPLAFGGGGSGGITQLTGDVTAGPGTSSVPATLATVNSNVGLCGDATHVSQITLDAKGRATACTPIAIVGAGGSSGCGTLTIAASTTTRVTTPTTCSTSNQGYTSGIASPSNNYIDVSASGTGTIDTYFDLPGIYYTNYTLTGTAPTCGGGSLCTGASGAPTGANSQWISHAVVTNGVITSLVAKDVSSIKAVTFSGYNETTGANGERLLTYDTHITRIRVVSGTSDNITSADCSGLINYISASAIAVTVPTPGTSGMSLGCWFGIIPSGGGAATLTGGTYLPTGKNVVASGASSRFTSNGSANYYVEAGAGTGGSSGGLTTSVFNTTGVFTCPASGYFNAQIWGAGSSGGGGYFTGGRGGTGGGYASRMGCTCTPSASVTVTVGTGGTWSSGEQGGDGGNSSISGCVTALGGKWLAANQQSPGYDNTNTVSTDTYYYLQRLLSNNDVVPRIYAYVSVNLPDNTTTTAPVQEDLGGIGVGNASAHTAGTNGNQSLSGGAGGGGGANEDTGGATAAGGTAAKSRYCTSGAGGSVTSGVGTVGGNGTAPGCAGGGGAYAADGVHGGGNGANGRGIVQF